MSTVRLAQLAPLVAPAAGLSRAIPMLPMARRRGPCAVFPAGAAVAPVLRRAGTVVELVPLSPPLPLPLPICLLCNNRDA